MRFSPLLFILLILALQSELVAQLNIKSVSALDYVPVLNDIWGYVDGNGTEYALVGTTEGVSVVSLADPAEPKELQFIPGQSTVWRDLKTWGDFMYVVSDNTQEGLLIADLSGIANDSIPYTYWTGPVGDLGNILRSHNLYIDDEGLLYLAGSNLGGVVVLDVKSDPWNPQLVLKTPAPYAHDIYVRDSIIYASEIYLGRIAAWDISNTEQPTLLGSAQTPSEFTHNAWLSDDSQTVFTTDERADAYVAAYDISDFGEITELDRYRTRTRAIPHNVHVFEDYLVISYYTQGCVIVDAARPDNLVKTGHFVTSDRDFPEPNFDGAWGAYPFLPSGLILVSDRQTGLHVLQPEYTRACYIEGVVVDAETLQPVLGATVAISDTNLVDGMLAGDGEIREMSSFDGSFKAGKAVPGVYEITATHPEYVTSEQTVEIENGRVSSPTIFLSKLPRRAINGQVISSESRTGLGESSVVVTNDQFVYETTADINGNFEIEGIIDGVYSVYAAVWGEFDLQEVELDSDVEIELIASSGYYDPFQADLGWTVIDSSSGAGWERGVPTEELYLDYACGPSADVPDDPGNKAYVTGIKGGDARDNSVGRGYTLLSSPPMDLTAWDNPVMSFSAWLCVNLPTYEHFFVLASSSGDTVILDTIRNEGLPGYWREGLEYTLFDHVAPESDIQIHFLVENPSASITVKAAIDNFEVAEATTTSTSPAELSRVKISVAPNPVISGQYFEVLLPDASQMLEREVRVYNSYGQLVYGMDVGHLQRALRIEQNWPPDVYFIEAREGRQRISVARVVVQ